MLMLFLKKTIWKTPWADPLQSRENPNKNCRDRKISTCNLLFNGGREEPFEGEQRIMCPSPKVATYDLQPEMSAFDVRDAILPKIKEEQPDFICLNFANPDMVGHTGDLQAAIKACENRGSMCRRHN